MTVIHVLPKRFEDFLRHLDCNSPVAVSRAAAKRKGRANGGRYAKMLELVADDMAKPFI